MKLLFAEPVSKLLGACQRSRHGNRQELRELVVSSELNEWAQWPYLGQVGRLISTRECQGKITRETCDIITGLSSAQASPEALLRLIRGHWGIENRVHWVRDVTLDEDRCQVRVGSAPQVMAALPNTALGLLRLKGARYIAAAQRTLAWHAARAIAPVTGRRRITQ